MNQRIQTQPLSGHCLIAAALWATLLPCLHAQTPAAPSVDTRYIQRVSFLMRQGLSANQGRSAAD
jgi:hypothetical protein